jgi:diaminopimelate epimerase
MCGNGIRCFCRYIVEEGYTGENVSVETLVGILKLRVKRDGWWVRVDMGVPKFEASEIPAEGGEEIGEFRKKMRVIDREFEVFAANTGVPHAVIFLDSLDFDIVPYGREIRFSPIFPEGTNVNFAKVVDEHNIQVRTYERGVEAETLSCGTGSVAVAAVAVRQGLAKNPVTIHTRGGVLIIELEGNRAYMTGTASRVFEGFINTRELRI